MRVNADLEHGRRMAVKTIGGAPRLKLIDFANMVMKRAFLSAIVCFCIIITPRGNK